MKPSSGRLLIGIAGLTLLVGFFLPWIDVGSSMIRVQVSGFNAVRASNTFGGLEAMMIAVPIAGLAMMIGAFASTRAARIASLVAGLTLGGFTGWKIVSTFFAVTGWGLWLVIAAGMCAVVAPMLIARESRSRG